MKIFDKIKQLFEKIKQFFTKKEQVDKENIRKIIVYYYDTSHYIAGTKFFNCCYPDLITILLESGFAPSIGEAYRLLNMGQISTCVVGSVHKQKVSPNCYMNTSIWLHEIREPIEYIIDKGIILYKGNIPVYIKFREADSLETYVKQLKPFKKYLKGEIGNRYDYSTYSLEIYNEAIRQIRTND